MGELATDQVFKVVDEGDAANDLFLGHTRVLVRLILIVVHELFKVAHVGLDRRPGGLHEVLLASHGLAGPRHSDLIHLNSESLNALLRIPITPLELISAHF